MPLQKNELACSSAGGSCQLSQYHNMPAYNMAAAPDLGLWRPLGNNVIEYSSTSRAYQLNDCKNMHSIMLQLEMSRNVAACYRPGMSLPLRRQTSAMGSMYFSFENERLPLQLVTMRIRFVRCAISIFGNEHLIRLSIVSL